MLTAPSSGVSYCSFKALFLFYIFLEDLRRICETTDSSVLDLWCHRLWPSKADYTAVFTLGGGIHVTYSLRFTSGANTVQPLGSQHGSQAVLFHIPASRHCCGLRLGPLMSQMNALPTDLY